MNNITIFIVSFCVGFAIECLINYFINKKSNSGNIIIDEDVNENKMKYLFEFGISPEELATKNIASFKIVHKKLQIANDENDS